MTTEALKSPSITNLDATPVVNNTTGAGAPGELRAVSDVVTGTTGVLLGSTYRLARFPTTACVKHVYVWLDAGVTTFAADIDVAFSDSAVDGTTVANQGTIPQVASADNKLFGAAVDLHAITTPTDYVAAMGGANRNKPMWQVLGYTTDPGGYFDLMLKGTGTTSGAPIMNGEVQFVI